MCQIIIFVKLKLYIYTQSMQSQIHASTFSPKSVPYLFKGHLNQ